LKSKSTGNGKAKLEYARTVIRCEASAVASLEGHLGDDFLKCVDLILGLSSPGRVVVTGMGKAGLMGQKIAATFASTGTPALFMHPAEAVHGDLGMVTAQDLVLAISNSGETEELLRLLPLLKQIRCQLLAFTSSATSSLGKAAAVTLCIGKLEEPCPFRLAPSASTTALLALGDALALTVLKARGFTQEDYARLHPAGALGRKLLKAADAMRSGSRMVKITGTVTVVQALALMAQPPRNGAAVIVDGQERLVGIFTHGDFSRLVLKSPNLINEPVALHMTSPCAYMHREALVMDAQVLLHDKHINALPVVDDCQRVLGLLDIQDLV